MLSDLFTRCCSHRLSAHYGPFKGNSSVPICITVLPCSRSSCCHTRQTSKELTAWILFFVILSSQKSQEVVSCLTKTLSTDEKTYHLFSVYSCEFHNNVVLRHTIVLS